MEEKIKELFALPLDERLEYFMKNMGISIRDGCVIGCIDLSDEVIYIGSIKYGKFAFRLSDLTLEFDNGKMNNAESITKFFVEEILKKE